MSNSPPETLKVGALFQERYEVVELIGRGGMGAVFLCHDKKLPGTRWAIKEMRVANPESLERVKESFQREARFLSSLRHPGMPFVVDVHQVGNLHYLVMEYVEGQTLLSKVETEGPPSDAQALEWTLQLTEVLEYLHGQDPPVIFRDLKPENIMISTDGRLKVVDFGLARHFQASKTRDTMSSGTIGYTAPEQWEDAEQSDARSDIYSLGATLFFLVSGQPPGAVYSQIDVKKHRPDLCIEIEEIVVRCMALKPAHRYQIVGEVKEKLQRLLAAPEQLTVLPVATEVRRGPRSAPRPLSLPDKGSARVKFGLIAGLIFFVTGLALPGMLKKKVQPVPAPTTEAPSLPQRGDQSTKQKVREQVEQGRYDEALSQLARFAEKFPSDPEALILKNNALAARTGRKLYRIPVVSSWAGDEEEGFDALYGWALAQQKLNESRPDAPLIFLDTYSDNSKPEDLLNIVRGLTADPRIPLMIGPWSSQQSLLIAPLINQGKLPVITPLSSDPRVLSSAPDIFCVADTDINKTRVLADYLRKEGKHKATVLADRSRYVSRTIAGLFIERFEELGGELVFQEAYDHDAPDFTVLLEEARKRESDCIFLAEYRAAPVHEVHKLLVQDGWDVTLAAQTGGMQASEGVEGLLSSSTYIPELFDSNQIDFAKSFESEFAGREPTHREAQTYDSLFLAVAALDAVGPERAKISNYLRSVGRELPNFRGVSGEFAPSRHLNARPAFVVEIVNGQYRPLLEVFHPLSGE